MPSHQSLACTHARAAVWRGAVLAIAVLSTISPTARATAAPETIDSTFPASVSGAGEYADQSTAETPSISANGRYVAFASAAGNLGEHGPTGVQEAYVKDLETGEVKLVSRANGPDGEPADEPGEGTGVEDVTISGDGLYVIFTSAASNLVSGLPPAAEPSEHPLHVYRRDLQTGETTLVDRVTGVEGAILDERGARAEAISEDGRYVLFRDGVEDLEDPLGSHEPGTRTVYVRDMQTGTTTAVSRADGATGELANESSRGSAISADGRYVAFESSATNLVEGMGSNTASQVYLRDLQNDITTLASATPAGEPGNSSSEEPILAGEPGCEVAFSSQATNLFLYQEAPVLTPEVYLADLCSTPSSIALVSRADGLEGAPAGEGNSVIPIPRGASTDGAYVLFGALSELTGEGAGTRSHLYVRDLAIGHTTLIDRESGASGEPAKGNPEGAVMSENGCRVAFTAEAGNLGEPSHRETYVRQLASCQPPEEQDHQRSGETGGGQEPPTTGGDSSEDGLSQNGAGASTGSTRHGAGRASNGAMSSKIVHIDRKRLVLKVRGTGRIVVEIARARGHRGRRHWHEIKTIALFVRKAGQVEVRMPRLAAGRYRITIVLSDRRSAVRVLVVRSRQ
jgi:hypothetical protein